MASCSRWRGASAPADAPRRAELSSSAPRWAVSAVAVPRCLSWIASTSWPLRIRPTPVIPMDCAIRCSSGSSRAESPPDPRAACAVTAPAAGPAACPWPDPPSEAAERRGPVMAEVGGRSGAPGWAVESPVGSGEPVKRSVVSLLTRGPSQSAGAGRHCGWTTRCCGPANWAGPGCALAACLRRLRPRRVTTLLPNPASAVKAEGAKRAQAVGEAHPDLRSSSGSLSLLRRWCTRRAGGPESRRRITNHGRLCGRPRGK